jgi:hypothetical protein
MHTEVEKVVADVNAFLEKDWTDFKSKIDFTKWTLFKTIDPLK